MIKVIKLQKTLQNLIDEVQLVLKERDLGKIVNFECTSDTLTIRFQKFGTSEVKYKVQTSPESTICTHESEKIAFAHNALRGEIEGKLIKVLEQFGAVVES